MRSSPAQACRHAWPGAKARYSLYLRMEKNQLSFAKVTDVYGFRVILPRVIGCYTALGVLHPNVQAHAGPLQGLHRHCKNNGYRSLHTTLSLLDIQNETRDAAEFWDRQVDLFPDAVYVFTPRARSWPCRAAHTVVDFAYAIHSKVGNRMTAARINNEEVPLRTELKSSDVVQIVTSEDATLTRPGWAS
ncbi:Dynamin-like 120 kDa protein, mitochondrial [Manis javanica]|nr:Dynamin-like 120 kDa protein, mitochondrial [Manis javanica]